MPDSVLIPAPVRTNRRGCRATNSASAPMACRAKATEREVLPSSGGCQRVPIGAGSLIADHAIVMALAPCFHCCAIALQRIVVDIKYAWNAALPAAIIEAW